MQELFNRFDKQILGVLSCFDRVVLNGTLPHLGYARGMTSWLYCADSGRDQRQGVDFHCQHEQRQTARYVEGGDTDIPPTLVNGEDHQPHEPAAHEEQECERQQQLDDAQRAVCVGPAPKQDKLDAVNTGDDDQQYTEQRGHPGQQTKKFRVVYGSTRLAGALGVTGWIHGGEYSEGCPFAKSRGQASSSPASHRRARVSIGLQLRLRLADPLAIHVVGTAVQPAVDAGGLDPVVGLGLQIVEGRARWGRPLVWSSEFGGGRTPVIMVNFHDLGDPTPTELWPRYAEPRMISTRKRQLARALADPGTEIAGFADDLLVYADALQAAGDSRGRLITLELLRPDAAPEIASIRESLRQAFHDRWAELLTTRGSGWLMPRVRRWRLGFAVELDLLAPVEAATDQDLRPLFTAQALDLTSTLRVALAPTQLRALVEALEAPERCRSLDWSCGSSSGLLGRLRSTRN